MSTFDLVEIQKLQFTDKTRAEELLLTHLRQSGVGDISGVKVVPKPQSLNSISGFVTLNDGQELFFKTHTEESEQLAEYYNSALLESVGYPVIKPELAKNTPGSQVALYKKITIPTLFDVVHEEELKDEFDQGVVSASEELDKTTTKIFLETARQSDGSPQPIEQLFTHRLADKGRFNSFYKGAKLKTDREEIRTDELFTKRWTVNGTLLPETLLELTARAKACLKVANDATVVVGHGDAHLGNIFYDSKSLYYFDPAFCGTHNPWLDLVKPLFHNIFARWMYLPDFELNLDYKVESDTVVIEHDFEPSRLREALLDSKIKNIIEPLSELKTPSSLDVIRFGMLCCPLLTVNLTRTEAGRLESRYPWKVRMLGFCLAAQVGNLEQPDDKVGHMLKQIQGAF